MHEHEAGKQNRIIARVIRDLLQSEAFASLADLTDVLKSRLVKFHIAWTEDAISAAFAMIASNRSLVADPFGGLARVEPKRVFVPSPGGLSREDAARIYAEIVARYAKVHGQVKAPTRGPDWPEHFPNLVEIL